MTEDGAARVHTKKTPRNPAHQRGAPHAKKDRGMVDHQVTPPPPQPRRLLNQVRDAIRGTSRAL